MKNLYIMSIKITSTRQSVFEDPGQRWELKLELEYRSSLYKYMNDSISNYSWCSFYGLFWSSHRQITLVLFDFGASVYFFYSLDKMMSKFIEWLILVAYCIVTFSHVSNARLYCCLWGAEEIFLLIRCKASTYLFSPKAW